MMFPFADKSTSPSVRHGATRPLNNIRYDATNCHSNSNYLGCCTLHNICRYLGTYLSISCVLDADPRTDKDGHHCRPKRPVANDYCPST